MTTLEHSNWGNQNLCSQVTVTNICPQNKLFLLPLEGRAVPLCMNNGGGRQRRGRVEKGKKREMQKGKGQEKRRGGEGRGGIQVHYKKLNNSLPFSKSQSHKTGVSSPPSLNVLF